MTEPERAIDPPDYGDETDADFWQRRTDLLEALDTEEIQDMACMAVDEGMAKLIKRLVMLIPNPTASERMAIGNALVDRLMDERERYLKAHE